MAPARSIQCIRRPPRSAASGLASLGSTISAISDCESRTGRGARLSSDIRLSLLAVERVLEDECSTLLFQVGIQKTLGHPLHACVSVLAQPGCTRKVKLQFTMFYGKMIAFADVKQAKSTHRSARLPVCCALGRPARRPQTVPRPRRVVAEPNCNCWHSRDCRKPAECRELEFHLRDQAQCSCRSIRIRGAIAQGEASCHFPAWIPA